jgi:hypothetical protein
VGRRLADGLVRVCSGSIAEDPDPDRGTVVVHVQATPRASFHTWGRAGEAPDRPGGDRFHPDPRRHRVWSGPVRPGVIEADITSAEIESGR